ncbi:cytochrome c-type biogenesis protein CcmH [Oricola thermophila]|uniref:Cytochrome c-type biogenesis protein n=2 Tax=Oricola thermophila TaxID=2742145 RepID=A0A6N1VG51_9HYPH|nr:cytochrome c-type biogenesis protein CcmH [Oricola thermophila]
MKRFFAACVLVLLTATGAMAVNPDEMLDDPVLEQRARDISAKLRCLVCQNQSIDDSDAELARDLRVIVRERLVEGDTDEEVMDFVVARYGEFVLLRPRMSARNLLLWGTPLLGLLLGGAAVAFLYRGRSRAAPVAHLTPEEQERINKLLADGDDAAG